MELGVGGRGEHSEILAFMGTTVDSEVSGNAIDLCPVGALTSKPFRFVARSWELSRVPSISPHDALGTQVEVQVKLGKDVVRVLPRKNDDINECWLADRDRFPIRRCTVKIGCFIRKSNEMGAGFPCHGLKRCKRRSMACSQYSGQWVAMALGHG